MKIADIKTGQAYAVNAPNSTREPYLAVVIDTAWHTDTRRYMFQGLMGAIERNPDGKKGSRLYGKKQGILVAVATVKTSEVRFSRYRHDHDNEPQFYAYLAPKARWDLRVVQPSHIQDEWDLWVTVTVENILRGKEARAEYVKKAQQKADAVNAEYVKATAVLEAHGFPVGKVRRLPEGVEVPMSVYAEFARLIAEKVGV